MFFHRVRVFRILVYLSFIALIAGLFYFQIVRHAHYRSQSLKNTIRIIPLQASRGGIYDRNNKPLAVDEISFDLVIVPQEVKDPKAVIEKLSRETGIEEKVLLRNYKRNYLVPFAPAKIAENIEKKKAFSIEEKIADTPGALIRTNPRRNYPNNEAGAHVLGYVGVIDKPEFEVLKDYGYKIQDVVGKSGIEKEYDAYLKGEDGGIQIEVDSLSRQVRELGFKQPKKGKDIKLTIDTGVQCFADMLFKEKSGSCIIMDVKTGGILALTSSPEFDPNVFTTGSSAQRSKLLIDKQKPLIDRAISSAYPPGSTFKIIVATAGLATGALTKNTTFTCNGLFKLGNRSFKCWKESGHGPQNVIDALMHSCNVFFYNLGRALGAEGIQRYAVEFGLGSLTGIDLPGEIKASVPGPLWKRFYNKEPWYEGDTINYSIGQGYLLVTPIQMLRAVTIVANEGYSPTPYLVDEIEGRKAARKRDYISRIKEGAYKAVKEGLFKTVNDSTGTGQYARIKGVDIAGKTGTAQPGTPGATHAWFVGYMPAQNPVYSFVVMIEHGGQGGKDAAYVVRLLTKYMYENGLLNR